MAFNEYGTISRIGLRHASAAFVDQDRIDSEWQTLNYHSAPNFEQSVQEYDTFLEALALDGANVHLLEQDTALTLDALYVRDALLTSPNGLILANMGKLERRDEPIENAASLEQAGVRVAGRIKGDGRLEGGDFVWFDEQTCAVGEGYRTNAEGIAQLRELLGPRVHVQVCDLPHYKGPGDVFHLMSMLSPLDRDLALVHSPLMPVRFRSWLIELGLQLVEVPDEEFEAMACNVLATSPRRCVMVEGCPLTETALRKAGCEVITYRGAEISRKGEGGPTCLTRALERLG